jgi:PAS domain S-box-containing protein
MRAPGLPLRLLLPLLLLLFGGVLMASFTWTSLRETDLFTERETAEDVRYLGTTMAGEIERALRRYEDDAARSEVRYARADRRLQVALVFDEDGLVLYASDPASEGRDLRAVLDAEAAAIVPAVRQTQRSEIRRSREGMRLFGAHPVRLRPRAGEIVSSRVGVLFTVHDLTRARRDARVIATRQALAGATLLLALVGVNWWLLHARVVRRLQRLVEAAGRVARGEVAVRAAVGGSDEIAGVSAAFDAMAARLDQERQRLREREEWFRELIEQGSDVIAVVDDGGRLEFVSPAAARVFGPAAHAPEGTTLSAMVHEDDRADLAQLLEPDGGAVTRQIRVRADGHWRTVEVVSARSGRHPQRIILNARDVSERVRLEEQLRQSQKMEAIGRMAGGIAHDFNNLLTAILGYADVLGDQDLAPQARKDLEAIQHAASTAGAMTGRLLAFSRKQATHAGPVEVNDVVRRIEPLLKRLVLDHIAMDLQLAPGAQWARIDAQQVEQVILNLVLNARDAMDAGGRLTLRTESASSAREFGAPAGMRARGAFTCLSVQDTGTGMTEETAWHLFEPFFTTKGGAFGTGLGLATVYAIVKQAGGFIDVETAPGQGTVMRVYLQRAERPAAVLTPPGQSEVSPGSRAAAETILVAEDEQPVRALMETVLERHGYRVLSAAGGQEAIDLAAGHDGRIDLLLSDVVMEGMQGPELAERLADARPGLRVLFVSGHTDPARLPRVGPDRWFMQKPFRPSELAHRVRALLDVTAEAGSPPAGRPSSRPGP